MTTDKYILHGKDIIPEPDLLAWAEWFEDPSNRVIAKTMVGPIEVSTVFLGLDHNWGSGEPILFETMIFGIPEGDKENYYERRCATYEEAEAMHEKACAWARELIPCCESYA
jgi:hypothetical protein